MRTQNGVVRTRPRPAHPAEEMERVGAWKRVAKGDIFML